MEAQCKCQAVTGDENVSPQDRIEDYIPLIEEAVVSASEAEAALIEQAIEISDLRRELAEVNLTLIRECAKSLPAIQRLRVFDAARRIGELL